LNNRSRIAAAARPAAEFLRCRRAGGAEQGEVRGNSKRSCVSLRRLPAVGPQQFCKAGPRWRRLPLQASSQIYGIEFGSRLTRSLQSVGRGFHRLFDLFGENHDTNHDDVMSYNFSWLPPVILQRLDRCAVTFARHFHQHRRIAFSSCRDCGFNGRRVIGLVPAQSSPGFLCPAFQYPTPRA